MLNGIDPVILFHFSKKIEVANPLLNIPIVASVANVIEQPPIPVYLSEEFFGVVIDTESKNIDISTEVETKADGSPADVKQKGANSSVSISLRGKTDSVPLTLLSAFMDLALDKVTSGEYAITYLHGATTIFRGLLKSYAVDQQEGADLLLIKIELTKGESQPVPKAGVGAVPALTDIF